MNHVFHDKPTPDDPATLPILAPSLPRPDAPGSPYKWTQWDILRHRFPTYAAKRGKNAEFQKKWVNMGRLGTLIAHFASKVGKHGENREVGRKPDVWRHAPPNLTSPDPKIEPLRPRMLFAPMNFLTF